MLWHKFREKRGSLHIGRRIEVATAPISFFTGRAAGSKSDLEDFMPHETEQAQADETDEQMLSFFDNYAESHKNV